MCRHPAILKMSTSLDLKHICGYITMIYLPEKDCILPPKLNCRSSELQECHDELKLNCSVDGFTDSAAAEILASELDKLDLEPTKYDNDTTDDNVLINSGSQYVDDYGNWTLLDCFYGLPLFDLQLNKDICQRILSHNLCNSER